MLNRKSMIQDLINKYGVTREEIVTRVVGDDPKDVEKGLQTLELIIDYRDVNLDSAKKFAKAIGATEDEVNAAVADIELYRKTIKNELDVERNEKIAQATAQIHEEMDELVKSRIDSEIYGKGAEWKAAQNAEKAARAAAKKASKKAKEETTEVSVEESGDNEIVNPFDE